MQRAHSHVGLLFLGLLSTALALGGCSGVNAAAPGAVAGSPVQSLGDAPAATNAFAGQYTGSVTDSTFGNGKSTASFAQSQGAVGGMLNATFGKTALLHSVAGNATNQSLSGTSVATVGKNSCVFSYSATYTSSSHKLSLGYTAAHGCSGEKGTVHLTKQCYYQEGAPLDVFEPNRNGMRPDTGLRPC